MSTTEEIFNTLMLGTPLAIELPTVTQYHTLRTALLRRYAKWTKQFMDMGDDTYAKQFISATYVDGVGNFALKPKEEMRRKQATYLVRML